MKYAIAILLSVLTFSASAQHRHGGYHHGSYGWGWVAPAIVTGAIVYGATRPAPPSVVYVPNPNPQVLPPAPYGYHYEQILDANCSCYRWVLIQG